MRAGPARAGRGGKRGEAAGVRKARHTGPGAPGTPYARYGAGDAVPGARRLAARRVRRGVNGARRGEAANGCPTSHAPSPGNVLKSLAAPRNSGLASFPGTGRGGTVPRGDTWLAVAHGSRSTGRFPA
ncbi:hypothetical protein JCM4914_41730 [Streptomyces platensis subsp. malvinus]